MVKAISTIMHMTQVKYIHAETVGFSLLNFNISGPLRFYAIISQFCHNVRFSAIHR